MLFPVASMTPRLVAAVLLGAALSTAAAAAESPWIKATDSKVRLISAAVAVDGRERTAAGVQIRMEAGWKTYWRNPGDSGVPPAFDWSGSSNLQRAEVLYPAPRRLADANGAAIGYEDEVVFPVLITPERPGEPVALKLNLSYGLCKDLCIPNEASLTLELPAKEATDQGDALLLTRFLDLMPKPAEAGQLPAVSAIEATLDGPTPKLVIETQFPAGATGNDLFIDAPEAYMPLPKADGPLDGGRQRFIVTFGSPAEAAKIKGKPLTLTLVYDRGGRQSIWTAP
jgi:DsbC/DsbD-like thiol-disulfide interchange protein